MQIQQPTQLPSLKIIGYISDVKPWRRGEPNQFIIATAKSGTFNCSAPLNMFCNVQPGDSIEAYVQLVGDRQLVLTRQPFIQFPVDEHNIQECFIRALRGTGFGAISAVELYKHLHGLAKKYDYSKPKGLNPTPPVILPAGLVTGEEEKAPVIEGIPKKTIAQTVGITDEPNYKPSELVTGPDGVIAVLSELAGAFATSGSENAVSTLMTGTRLQKQQATDLLRWWHNQRSLRRLYLLGLTKAEIRNANTNLDQLYEECLTNPYKVCSIPIDKCNNLMLSLGQTPKPDDVRAGEIVRKVHLNQQFGHTCTPYHLLKKNFIDLPDYKMYIEQEFKVRYEFDAVYTKYAHRVESTMALYFNELIKRTAIKLNALPEIDTPIMESALFECKTLDSEQKLAIQGALSHHICIIRGGAGTGKCLHPDEEILMFNGLIKKAKHIQKNDVLMGPDSKPRTVNSVCTGKDTMYQITPTIGKSFKCNEPHILTLVEKTENPKLIHSNIQFPKILFVVGPEVIGRLTAQYINCPFSSSFYWNVINILLSTQKMNDESHFLQQHLKKVYTSVINSRINEAYKYASISELKRFLVGYVDESKSLTESGIVIIDISKQLADDFHFVGHRLDLTVDIVPHHNHLTLKDRYDIHMYGQALKTTFSHSFTSEALQPKCRSQRFKIFTNETVPFTQEIFDIPLDEYLTYPDDIKSKLFLYHQGVEFPEVPVPISPFELGILLRKYNWSVKCLELNMSFLEYITSIETINFCPKLSQHQKNAITHIDGSCVPIEFKVNCRENRIQLLNGYFRNCIGYEDKNPDGIKIREYNLTLGDDIEYIALSVGLMVHKHKVWSDETHYEMKFFGSTLKDLTLSRKSMFTLNNGYMCQCIHRKECIHQIMFTRESMSQNCTLQSFTVKSLGSGQYCGFTLDGDGRFLLSDFVVTHNTMCIREIVRNLELREMSYAACSFTGKAVSRIADVLKRRCAMTMDRMIARPGGTKEAFVYCLIDEFSMVTLELMYRFVRSHPWDIRFIFIGDPGQLQPIGWGSVMHALIDCERVPVYTLNVNHRIIKHELDDAGVKQIGVDKAPGDIEFDRVILENANHLIDPKRDLRDPITFREGLGFYIYYGSTSYVTTILKSLADSGIDQSRVQILCPYTEPLKNLNVMAQSIFLPTGKAAMDPKQRIWKVADPVMMTHNNYTINVMNGETGKVTDVCSSNIKVMFSDGAEHTFKFRSDDPFQNKMTETGDAVEGGPSEYEGEELLVSHLVHSYAISVHKSQGSEFEFVIFYLPMHPSGKFTSFINRNLVYTAWTRTKRSVWTICDVQVLNHACKTEPSHRYEYLCRRLYQSRDKELETKMEAITKPKIELIKDNAGNETYDTFGHDDDDSLYEKHYQD
jgi:hypothetical protein